MSKVNVIKKGISYLFWQCPTGKVNPKNLGYILPNENINFVTKDGAMTYAKNTVVKALNSKIPYERGIIVKDSKIIADVKGFGNELYFGQTNLKDCFIVHGHPNSTPISVTDYGLALENCAKEIIAYNPKGEYSKLVMERQLPKVFSILPNKLKQFFLKHEQNRKIKTLESDYDKFLQPIDEKIAEQYSDLAQKINKFYCSAAPEAKKQLGDYLKLLKADLIEDLSEIPSELQPVLKDFFVLSKNEYKLKTPLIHRFWSENVSKYRAKYDTNYSNLI